MYTDADGEFKGDVLIVFFKPQSVEMAIMLLDDTDFRMTPSGTREGRIRVQEADSSYKKVQYDKENGAGGNGASSHVQSNEPKKPRSNDRQKIIKKTQKMDAKLADWSDDESPTAIPNANAKRDKTVVLAHMFTLQELDEDPAALLEIKEDIRDECSKLGAVTSVVLFDQEEDGIVTVKFKDSEAALACINLMHGRSFDGRTVQAYLSTGKEKFKRSKAEEGDEE
jgi:HIV Tat-specific factor 1